MLFSGVLTVAGKWLGIRTLYSFKIVWLWKNYLRR